MSREKKSNRKKEKIKDGTTVSFKLTGGKYKVRRKQRTARKIVKWCILTFLGLFVLFLLTGGIYFFYIASTSQDIDGSNIYSLLSKSTEIYDDEGEMVETLYVSGGNRIIVEYEDFPEELVEAVVAIEDQKFFTHHGFNFIRTMGAIKDWIFTGQPVKGTSTITQQLARNIYLSESKSERTLDRKAREAYYTIVLERQLTKEEILEAYLNSIYFGFNSYGAEVAANNYFSKSVGELSLTECVALAALPQAPDSYALVKADGSRGQDVIKEEGGTIYSYNGDASKDRREQIVVNMLNLGYIGQKEASQVTDEELRKSINIRGFITGSGDSYYTDYVIDQVTKDLAIEQGISEEDAKNKIYSGGLKIYSCMDSKVQGILSEEINDASNYTSIGHYRRDNKGNIVDSKGRLMLARYENYFDLAGNFALRPDEYEKKSNGDIVLLGGKRLLFYETATPSGKDVSIEFKSMFKNDNGFYVIEGGYLSVAQGYKSLKGGNCVIASSFIRDYPSFFTEEDGNLIVSSSGYSLKGMMRQPQAAAVIIDNSSGEIKAMMGGRGGEGKLLYNRAINPRQPGSSVKPIAVYGPALQLGYENAANNTEMVLDESRGDRWGAYITAGSVINDAPMKFSGKSWPKNSYGGYKGRMSLRKGVQISSNVAAVKTYMQIGPEYSIEMLKKVGITTVDEEGETNDINPAALALGGMTSGISPLEMAGAYATFPNQGVYKTPICYTKVISSRGEVLLSNEAELSQVYDKGIAWIMTDILQSVVKSGTGVNAKIKAQPVGGKTGTTTDKYDIWFVGFTPQYTMALWEGTDVNIALMSSSEAAARFWRAIMDRVCTAPASFPEMPPNVIEKRGEYYAAGTIAENIAEATESVIETTEADRETENREPWPNTSGDFED